MKVFVRTSAVSLCVVLSMACLILAGQNKHVGMWTIDLQDSKYSPGPAPKNVKLTIEPSAPDGIKLIADGENADGTPVHVEYVAQFDGKDYPVTGFPGADTVSIKRVDDKTVESHMKAAGKTVMTIRTVLSDDGKTRTSWWKGTNSQGQDVNNTVVYRRTSGGAQKAE
jgi:hypothetical protein